MTSKYDKLMDLMERDITDSSIIRLHPEDNRCYTKEELELLKDRDFKTRFFVSSLSLGNCVWLRTHHTDNASHETNFTYIRDYYKAACATGNHTAAKATLTALLTTMFAMTDSDYNSFATIVAGGLADEARNTSFEIHEALLKNKEGESLARLRLILLMDVLFSKVSIRRFLLERKNCNIYRLVYCLSKGNKNKLPLMYVLFSFLLQVCLTIFVIFEVKKIFDPSESDRNDDEEEVTEEQKYIFIFLAALGAIYSVLITIPEIKATLRASTIYETFGFFAAVDFVVNVLVPCTLILTGFIVIMNETNFIEAVLNAAALLFIPEIDDQLPALLGYDEKAIVENFLIKEAKAEYGRLKLDENDVKERFKLDEGNLGVDFNDYFITNSIERGREPSDFALYQPYIVRNCENDQNQGRIDQEIDPSNYITDDCLLKSVEWRYTHWQDDDSTDPRVGWLRLVKLNGEEVEINYTGDEVIPLRKETHSLEQGVYIITNFVMSSSILKLRLCGAKSSCAFFRAIEYYSLWDLTEEAKKLLYKYQLEEDAKKGMRRTILRRSNAPKQFSKATDITEEVRRPHVEYKSLYTGIIDEESQTPSVVSNF